MSTAAPAAPPPPTFSPATTSPSAPTGQSPMAAAAAAEAALERGNQPANKAPATPPAKAPAAPAAKAAPTATPPATPSARPSAARAALEAKPKEEGAKPAAPAKDDTPPKEQTRWKELKQAEEELQAIKPQLEATKREKEAWLKEKAAWEQERKELEELRALRDRTDITKSEGYKKEVEAPFAEVSKYAQTVADYCGVDVKALLKAMQDPNPLTREDSIAGILENATKPVKPGNIAKLVEEGDTLVKLFQKHDEYMERAEQLKKQHANGEKAQALQAETEAKQILERAHKEIHANQFKAAADVFDDTFTEAFKSAYKLDSDDPMTSILEWSQQESSDDPMDQAFRAQAEFLVPAMMHQVRLLKAKIAELTAEKHAEAQAAPGVRPAAPKPTGKERPYSSLQEATAAHREAGAAF